MVSQTHQQLIGELTAEMQVQQSQSQVQLPGSLMTAITDVMNYQVVTALTGTSMKIAFIAVW